MELRKQIKINNVIYEKMLGFFIKCGNKISAKRIVDTALQKLSLSLKKPIGVILIKIFSRFNTIIEVKKVRYRRGLHIVPSPIRSERNFYLTMKWILQSIRQDKRRVGTNLKLYSELLKIYIGKGSKSKSLNKYNQNKKLVLENRSNIHFRW